VVIFSEIAHQLLYSISYSGSVIITSILQVCQHYHLYQSDAIGSEESEIRPLISFEAKIYTLITFKDVLRNESKKQQAGSTAGDGSGDGLVSSDCDKKRRGGGTARGKGDQIDEERDLEGAHKDEERSVLPSPEQLFEMFSLLTSCPDKVCHRSLTIVPYIIPAPDHPMVLSPARSMRSSNKKKK
jgi:hypothetical protein